METGDRAIGSNTEWMAGAQPEWRAGGSPGHGSTPRMDWRQGNARPQAANRPEGAGTNPGNPSGGALWGLGLLMGAAAMYLLDAEHGEDRRAGVTRRVKQYRDEVERTIDRESERARARLRNTTRQALRSVRERLIPDETIRREIVARMEDVLPFEDAARIQVTVRRGRVTLEGTIAEDRHNRLLGRISTVPGVRKLDNRLGTYAPTADR